MATPQLSEEFGPYRLTHLLGKGGMASVFRALREGPHGFSKQVAIKRLHSSLNDNKGILKALINEARLGGQLKHPNIVEVYEFNKVVQVTGDAYYLAMEFVDGWTLDRVVKLAREFTEPVPPEVALDIMEHICAGLQYAHTLATLDGEEIRLVHRDLKPANIILGRDGVAKIMDFGIAKAATNLYKTTLADTTKGTPHYMSPEQVAGDPNIAASSDLFALGSVLYELVTGKLLFKGESLVSVLFAVAKAQVVRQMEELDRYLPGLGTIVGRCLSKSPAERYPDAGALGEAIATLRVAAGGTASIRGYLYTLRNHMVARDRGLQEDATVVDEAPQFATLLGADWDEAAEAAQEARELGEARKAADDQIGSFRSDSILDDDHAAWMETQAAASGVVERPQASAVARIEPRAERARRLSVPGSASPYAATEFDISAGDPDRTRDFPGVQPRRSMRLSLIVLLLVFGTVGVVGILTIGRSPSGTDEGVASNAPAAPTGSDGALPDLAIVGSGSDPATSSRPVRTPDRTPTQTTSVGSVTPEPSTPGRETSTSTDPTPGDLIPAPPPATGLLPPTTANSSTTTSSKPGKIKVGRAPISLIVEVDGDQIGDTPIFGHSLKAGLHRVRFKERGGDWSPVKNVTVRAGETTTIGWYDFDSRSWK